MRRRALLTSCVTVAAVSISGCFDDGESPSGGTDPADNNTEHNGRNESTETDEENQSGDYEDGGESATSDSGPTCDVPTHEFIDGEDPPVMDFVEWEPVSEIGETGAQMTRTITREPNIRVLNEGGVVISDGEPYELRINSDSIALKAPDGDRRTYGVGDKLYYRHATWRVDDVSDGSVSIEYVDSPTDLQVDWTEGDFVNVDGGTFVVGVEPHERLFLCRYSKEEGD
ncbi:uncharacterized protein NP_0278A [Natronomonas pharaonis DSM 2160]|uniref:Uncharacterized protein n=1 Tax=Natronomonas pharaonis (strain ATCC 35678 / DSM 2160 / CIP 103997 / JCM 8858 / NBRC 14720 / NCIMB 2260 / Gabara) TaxID=348780 RepID=A0A1U7ETK1_NATPD|nr:hypothetical protein [Natronomonas pharaonis]CAI48230.1 uncharacterized protein NP_0278A [Natronomonas pharaonis DSM 2160]